jgi:NADPH-dependent glutamate synthase beta subunit-like oxidoreductase
LQAAKTVVSEEDLRGLLDDEKLKYCYECGICTASCPIAELLGEHYNPRTLLEKIVLNPNRVLTSYALWLCAWCYRCYQRCPQALKLPDIFLHIREAVVRQGCSQPLQQAFQKIVENIPLPLVTMLVCFHPERAGLKLEEILDEVEQLRAEHLKEKPALKANKGKIAVIGSGPAGLTVAQKLSLEEYAVTVFEALPMIGGMLGKCVPDHRLPKKILVKETQVFADLGVDIRTGVTVGKDVSFDDLREEGYKAFFIGVGAHKSRKLIIPGVDLKGVVQALNFLWDMNSGKKMEMGKNVVVVGGGNVAMDVAKAVLRLGADEVTILYRRSREEMPANPWEVEETVSEGVKIKFLVAPKKILGESGKVSAVECIRTELGELDDTGRRKPVAVEDSEFVQKTDMVILAIGETPDLEFLPEEVELNENGTIWVNPITMETSLKGVFAGGDAVTGPATVIEAIQAGKRAAESIDEYLRSAGE